MKGMEEMTMEWTIMEWKEWNGMEWTDLTGMKNGWTMENKWNGSEHPETVQT